MLPLASRLAATSHYYRVIVVRLVCPVGKQRSAHNGTTTPRPAIRPQVVSRYEVWLENLAPFDASSRRYHHNRTGEDNADAHMKRQIMEREVVFAITDGELHLVPWEHIFYYEFDGRRRKQLLVKLIGE